MTLQPLTFFLTGLALSVALAQGGPLLPCTAANIVLQEQQSNCVVANPAGTTVTTISYTNSPTFVNTPVSQSVNQYQTTLTALLNGGTTVFQQTFAAPFSDSSVQNAILQADGLLTLDGATFGSPLLIFNSTTLQSSLLSYVPTSPTFDTPTLLGCGGIIVYTTGTEICSGVTVTYTALPVVDTFGPATIMIGPDNSDQFVVLGGQLDINVTENFTYVVHQNAVTTNTFLTTQSYDINGTTSASPVPEPGTWGLTGCALAFLAFRRRRRLAPHGG
jgi:hypothetical protein